MLCLSLCSKNGVTNAMTKLDDTAQKSQLTSQLLRNFSISKSQLTSHLLRNFSISTSQSLHLITKLQHLKVSTNVSTSTKLQQLKVSISQHSSKVSTNVSTSAKLQHLQNSLALNLTLIFSISRFSISSSSTSLTTLKKIFPYSQSSIFTNSTPHVII